MNNFTLNGKVALVTGGGRGIGAGISKALAESNAAVIVSSRDIVDAKYIADSIIKQGGNAIYTSLDINSSSDITDALELGLKEFGHVDILVNNAAVNTFKQAVDLTIEEWDHVFDTNVRSLFYCSQCFAKKVISRGYKASIVNIASNGGKVSFLNQVHYNASKSAVISITQSLSKEFAKYNINVNAVCPGAVDTDMLSEAMKWTCSQENDVLTFEKLRKEWAPPQLGRLINPIEVGRVVAFLASDAASIIRGQAINIDAGITIN